MAASYRLSARHANGFRPHGFVYDPYGTVHKLDATWTAAAAPDWQYYHQGGYLTDGLYGDGLYHFRHRSYDPKLGT